MRVLDPRLYRRARAVRSLLIADALLGLAMALLVLAQAILLARVAARGFAGASLDEVAWPLVLLVAVVAARALAAWGFEVAGRRAATGVISQLRLDLVATRLRSRPAALDGVQSAEVATASVSGVDALETTFAKYVPQVVLAVVVPVAVLVVVAAIDLIAAGVMLLTLPLVPLFMWLVGRYTQQRARERWQALALLSNHFLDVVRGLPTLRAFNRGQAQAKRIEEVSDEYRRTTMGTLRIAFLSGAILELAATLGIALVAVVVGVRLAEGGIGFEAALTVLVLAPELYLPLRNLAAQFHASADGAAVAERMLDLSELVRRSRAALCRRRVPRPRRSRSSACRSRTRVARSTSCALSISSFVQARWSPSSGRVGEGRARSCRSCFGSPSPPPGGSWSGEPISRRSTSLRGGASWRSSRSHPLSSAGPIADNVRLGDAVRTTMRVFRRRSSWRAPTTSSPLCRRGTRRSSATGVAPSPPVSGGGWRSREHSYGTLHSSCSTSRPPTSIRRAPPS